ncbi:MAG: hypothetical protein IH807_12345 [Proteobacteria bacterium]|nr:hypothetical protein [Pseudomonadota bacterium]
MTDDTLVYINGQQITAVSLAGANETLNTVLNIKELLGPTSGVTSSDPIDECGICLDELTDDWIALMYFNQVDTLNLWEIVPNINNDLRGQLKNFTARITLLPSTAWPATAGER